MAQSTDIAIVGGGVIGLSAAYGLAKEGLRVTILDRGDFGQESSWAGAGMLVPGNLEMARTPFDRLRSFGYSLYPGLADELRQRTGIDIGYLRCGGLEFLAPDQAINPEEWHGSGLRVEMVEPRRIEPALADNLGKALHIPDFAQVRNPRLLRALVAGCESLQVRLLPQAAAQDFIRQGSRVSAIVTAQGPIHADQFLIAAGAWGDVLLERVGCRLGIVPVRGQIALLRLDKPLFRHVLMRGAHYLVPRDDGHVLAGSTDEYVGFDKRNTARAIQSFLAMAGELVPALADATLDKCWAGLRPGSPDGLPFLGRVPGVDNLLVAAGHYRSGIQMAPATAVLLKELMLGQPPSLPLEPFRLDRNPPAG